MAASGPDQRYGATGVRLLRLSRSSDRHEARDLTVDVAVEGPFEEAADSEFRGLVAAETMRNTVYALAVRHGRGEPEAFALALTHHFTLEHPRLDRVRVEIRERAWSPLEVAGKPFGSAFHGPSAAVRLAAVARTGETTRVEAGLERIRLLKTADSTLRGFARDRYTTLPDQPDRVLDIELAARWRYGWAEVPFRAQWHQVRRVLFDAFAEHTSESAQHTLHVLGRAVLDQCPVVAEIALTLAHAAPAPLDLGALGMEASDEIFAPADTREGVVEAVLRRGELGS